MLLVAYLRGLPDGWLAVHKITIDILLEIDIVSIKMNCNRLTKNKKPCCNPAIFYTACRIHATEQDKEIFKWGSEQWSSGYKAGEEQGRKSTLAKIEQDKRRAEYEIKEKENFKLRTSEGHQIVCCEGYSYAVPTNLPDLKVGDVVTLPANWLINHPSTAKVTSLGTSYMGDLAFILGIVQKTS